MDKYGPAIKHLEACLIRDQVAQTDLPGDFSLMELQHRALASKKQELKEAKFLLWRDRYRIMQAGLEYTGDDYEYKLASLLRAISIMVEGQLKGYADFIGAYLRARKNKSRRTE